MLRVYNNTARYVDQGGNKVRFKTKTKDSQMYFKYRKGFDV